MMETHALSEESALVRLREEFGGHRIWRSRRPDGTSGLWVATLHDRSAGVDATILRPDPDGLHEALVSERNRAAQRDRWSW
ncbi:hypothetical protein GCM10010182_04140 [Actinomadura cremea]|nr:hypothetical protein GCM10010182_04140 [Actinomadura cremea]